MGLAITVKRGGYNKEMLHVQSKLLLIALVTVPLACQPGFATLVPEDTYVVASEVHDLLVKTHPADVGKIAEIKALVWEHLFIDRILAVASEVSPPA